MNLQNNYNFTLKPKNHIPLGTANLTRINTYIKITTHTIIYNYNNNNNKIKKIKRQ